MTPKEDDIRIHAEAVESRNPDVDTLDDGAIDGDASSADFTPADDVRVRRRIDLHVLPIALVVYALQSLDKTTLSYASVFGLVADLHLHGRQYSWAGAVVYVAQLIWQPVVAYALVALPLGKTIAAVVLGWGATLCATAAAHNFAGLLVGRFVLGSFEAAVAPAFIALVQTWYRREEQTNRIAAWYAMLGVVNIFGSLLSYGLAHIHSDVLRPFQIIFIFCGALTVAVAGFVFVLLPDSPARARFLSASDKRIAVERVRAHRMGLASGVWRMQHVRECLCDPKTWLWCAMLSAVSIPSGGITTFGPLIVQSFGLDPFSTLLFNMPFGAVQLLATLLSAYAATRWNARSPVLAALCIPPLVGISLLLKIPHSSDHRAVLLVAYYLTSVYPAITPLIYSWSAQNTAGDTKRKTTTAILFVGASAGNILGPNLYTPSQAPAYTPGLLSNLVLFALLLFLVGITTVWLAHLNARRARARGATHTSEGIDTSVRSSDESELSRDEDVTDLKNEEFVYIY